MTAQDPIRIDHFQTETRRIRSSVMKRQYQVSTTLAVLLFVASCIVISTARTGSITQTVSGVISQSMDR
jgi:hypothetical protein